MTNTITQQLIKQVDPNTKIWRFLTLEKFLWMIRDNAIYFCQVKNFEDDNEGKIPPFAPWAVFPNSDQDKKMRELEDSPNGWRSWTGATCWHMNDKLSYEIWDRYIPNRKGIVIESSVGLLKNAFEHATQQGVFKFGAIAYEKIPDIPPGKAIDMTEVILFRKTPDYTYEQEYRAIIWVHNMRQMNQNGGINVPTDLTQLIKRIYISESLPEHTKIVLGNLVQSANLQISIEFT